MVVAVEQLTGAIAANQVILTGSAGSSASASLVANQQLLDAARKDEAEKQKSLADAEKARDTQKQRTDTQRTTATQAKSRYEQAIAPGSTVSDDDRNRLKAELETEEKKFSEEETKLADAERDVEFKKGLLAESKRVREIIQDNKDAALTQATANTSGSGQFSSPSQRKELDKAATEQIANSVTLMVTEVLRKDYSLEACSTLLTSTPSGSLSEEAKKALAETRELCVRLLMARFEAETQKIATFGKDASSDRIRAALRSDAALSDRLNKWLRENAGGLSSTSLIFGAQNANLRQRAINDLRIP